MMHFENEENLNINLYDSRGVTVAKVGTKQEENVLLCAKFQESLHLNFGSVRLKDTKTIHFSLKNPSLNKSVQLSLDKSTLKSGLIVSLETSVDEVVTIQPLQSCSATALWTPTTDAMLREIIRFKMDDKGSLQVIVQGVAGKGALDAQKKRQTIDAGGIKVSKRKENLNRQSITTVASKAPIATSGQEDKWAEKQSKSFVDWMNFKFADSQISPTSTIAAMVDDDISPMEELTIKQREARLKQHASLMFKLSEFADVRRTVENEVQQQKLQLREDREILQDLGLQEALFGILYSYEMAWLSLGLEIVCGKAMKQKPSDNSPKSRNLVKTFVMESMFSNSSIVAKFPSQSGLYLSQEKKLKGMLRKHLLEKFLVLVLFLDKARMNNLMSLKSLFVKESIYKSSKDVLVSFCRCFLHGEGDILKHLGLIGYQVQFTQTYIDEVNCEVSNLAVDLRDGVRLALLLDVLTKSSSVSSQLRTPAVSRLQKLHNVGVVLREMFSDGVSPVDAKCIVDGNRDKTLILLWNIMYAFELRTIVNSEKIICEAQAINKKNGADSQIIVDCDIADCLLSWCQAIANPHGIVVSNLTSCLSDGKVLCLLVTYYHPLMLSDGFKETSKHISEQKRNLNAFLKACRNIGGIPPLISVDSKECDEKTMIIFLGNLFVRLTESSQQVKASTLLQRFFRANRSKTHIVGNKTLDRKAKRCSEILEHTLVWKDGPKNLEADTNFVNGEEISKVPLASEKELIEAKDVVKQEIAEKLVEEKLLLENLVAHLTETNSDSKMFETAEFEQKYIEELVVETAESSQLIALQVSEANLRFESEARHALELRIKAEVDARLALEEKLRQTELRNVELVETLQLKEISARLTAFSRKRSIIVIVRNWRAFRSKIHRSRLEKGVIRFQSVFRGAIQQKRYQCLLLAIQILQSSWRRKRCSRILKEMNFSASQIQKVWKQHQWRHNRHIKAVSAHKIFNWWRCVIAAKQYCTLKQTTVKLQCVIRRKLARKVYEEKRNIFNNNQIVLKQRATVLIERNLLSYAFRKRLLSAFESLKSLRLHIQLKRQFCGKIISRFCERVLLQRRKTASVALISKWFVSLLPRIRARKLIKGFRRLGALHQGIQVRKTNSPPIAFCLRRLCEAQQLALKNPGLKLGELSKKAIDNLHVNAIVSDLLKSCQILKISTEYSVECCDMFVQANKTSILLGLLRSCNRSESHQELLSTVLIILLNITRVASFASSIGESTEVTDCLVDLLQMFRDKKDLFKLACELLIRIVSASSKVKEGCKSVVVHHRLQGIQHIMERKDRLESRLRSIDARSSAALASISNKNTRGGDDPIHYIHHLMSMLQ